MLVHSFPSSKLCMSHWFDIEIFIATSIFLLSSLVDFCYYTFPPFVKQLIGWLIIMMPCRTQMSFMTMPDSNMEFLAPCPLQPFAWHWRNNLWILEVALLQEVNDFDAYWISTCQFVLVPQDCNAPSCSFKFPFTMFDFIGKNILLLAKLSISHFVLDFGYRN